jgi:heparosan-N-sulfate-glucuronate 5-epimerase
MARDRTDPDFFSSARSFATEVGSQIAKDGVRGYYVDFGFKAEEPRWPPSWLLPRDQQLHVATAQWGLGAYERFLGGEGDQWLEAALGAGRYLVDEQDDDGGWRHGMALAHTYWLPAPWISAMAQGEAASLLVRLSQETGDGRFAEAARRALRPLSASQVHGGVQALLGGKPFLEEYPTQTPSFVLNGGIFALWGCRDVGVGLGDPEALRLFAAGVEALAENIDRWDTGYWSRYDLFPHPFLPNVASGAYHGLHITQLRAMQAVAPRLELAEAISRFENYERSRLNRMRAFAVKSAFRLVNPRNRLLAHRLPWSESRRGGNVKRRAVKHSLVLCYHAVAQGWPSPLAVDPERLRAHLEVLVRQGYSGATFSEIASGAVSARAVAVTFDDGFRSVFERALPILSEFGLTGTVFVPAAHMDGQGPMAWSGIDRWIGTSHEGELDGMSWDQLRHLQRAGWEIASHTLTHVYLPELDDDSLERELVESKEICARELGNPCTALAYPYGAVNDRVVAAARDAGYLAAGALQPGPQDALRWPRIGVYALDGPTRFRLKASPLVRSFRGSSTGRKLESHRSPGARRPS